jgi:Zn-dependent peptidase ImmA (M78 family)
MNENLIAEKIVEELQYDFHNFSINHFVAFIGEKNRREIITIPWAMPPTLFGAWMSDDEEPREYIFYRNNVPAMHQVHIQLHELAHYLLGHPTLQINKKNIAQLFGKKAPLFFDELPRLRSSDTSNLEAQAETLAALIQNRAIKHSSLDQLVNDLSSEKKLANFLKTMGLT